MGPALSVRLRQMSRQGRAGANYRCPFYGGVHLVEVSIKLESLLYMINITFEKKQKNFSFPMFSLVDLICLIRCRLFHLVVARSKTML